MSELTVDEFVRSTYLPSIGRSSVLCRPYVKMAIALSS